MQSRDGPREAQIVQRLDPLMERDPWRTSQRARQALMDDSGVYDRVPWMPGTGSMGPSQNASPAMMREQEDHESRHGTRWLSPGESSVRGARLSLDTQHRPTELRKDRKGIPKLVRDRAADAAMQFDKFEQWLNHVMVAIAMWHPDAESYWSEAVKAARKAYSRWASMTPAERAVSGGTTMRLLGIRAPTEVPILEKVLRAELAEALPSYIVRGCMQKGLVSTIDLLGEMMQHLLPSEAQIRVKTLDALEAAMKPAKTFGDALTALREWHYRLRMAREQFSAVPDPQRLWSALSALVTGLTSSHGHSDFAIEWSSIVRSVGMREGATIRKIELIIPQLEAELVQRSLEEGHRKKPANDREWSRQEAEDKAEDWWDEEWYEEYQPDVPEDQHEEESAEGQHAKGKPKGKGKGRKGNKGTKGAGKGKKDSSDGTKGSAGKPKKDAVGDSKQSAAQRICQNSSVRRRTQPG